MSSNATSAPEPGQTLAGKYLVEQVLGIGGMGVVVSAKHLQLDQRVAIKYLLPQALLNPEVVERFAREARAAAKIRGEHVARVIDVGQFDDGAPYMVMEHLEGHDLAKHLELHSPLPIEDVVRYLLETCEALAEAHAAKIVHRDLKPSNMFLAQQPDRTNIIKVLDFGISKTGDAPSASLTKTSALMGTAFYMSPEQLTNPKGVDHRSDIWSLGVILFELLAGRPPFVGESVPEIIGGILQNEPESLRSLRTDVPAGLEAVVAKCMKSKAADRYQSVATLAAALGPFARPRDRSSIEITARVLGESLHPEPLASQSTVLHAVAPPSAQQQTGPRRTPLPADPIPPTLASAPPPPPAPPIAKSTVGTAPAVAAVTTHGLSTSAITPKPKRSPLVFVGVALVIGAVCTGIGIKVATSKDTHAAASGGLVAPPPASEPAPVVPATANAGATTAAPTTNLLPANPAPVTPPDPAPAAAPKGTGAPVATLAQPRPSPVVASAAPVKSAAPVVVASAAPPAPVTAPAPASAAPPPATPKNPLNMGIK